MPPITDLHDLRETAWAYRSSRVLYLANRIGVFTILSGGPMTAGEVAGEAGSDPDMTERLLLGCTALGLTDLEEGRFSNTVLSEEYLVEGRPGFQGNWVAHSGEDNWRYWSEGFERDLGGRVRHEEDGHRRFIMAMHDMAVAGFAQELADLVDLTGRRRLLDVGGGPGTYSLFLCKRYPHLHATVFDLPETLEITREMIGRAGMEGQVDTMEGDWMKDDFGKGHDVILMSNVLHGEGSEAEMKLAKAFSALERGGLLVIRDFIFDNDRKGPLSAAMFNLMLGAYTEEEMTARVLEAGFVKVRRPPLAHASHGMVLAERP